MMKNRSREDWIAQYSQSHQNRWNQLAHGFGIPMIGVALWLAVLSLAFSGLRVLAVWLFVGGWALQFIGHAIEGKPPEFFKDWRFLLVGPRWWWAKVLGRV